ncbi:MAG: ParB/RepB/Spo0J family partition protein [Firmicutes bacterium]|nr:ParB/RepB/Spo0J family partition protein [Bacillota bacterium]
MTKKRSSKRGLGKGLQALFPEEVLTPDQDDNVLEINVSDIRPNHLQPRREFDPEKIAELADSIAVHGVLQPIVVRSVIGGYELVAGERRWRASKAINLPTIPAIVRELSDGEVMEIALIENLQRENLNPLEEAAAYATLLEEFGSTQEELSRRIGKSRSHIANTLRLLRLPEEIRANVSRETISMGHARALLAVEDEEKQMAACRTIIEEDLSVRETEALVRRLNAGSRATGKRRPREKDPYIRELEGILQENLGTKVRIHPGKKRGRIEIEYYTDDDLERLCSLLGGVDT